MRKIFLFILFFISLKSFGQIPFTTGYPFGTPQGASNNIWWNKGSIGAYGGFTFITNYTDTSGLNSASYLSGTPGLLARTVDQLRLRSNLGNRWITLLTNENVGTFGWGVSGNQNTTAGTNFIGTTDAVNLQLRTNSAKRFTINTNGAFGLGTGEDYGTNGFIMRTNGSGSAPTWVNPSTLYPTWQQTLTAGSTLTGNNAANASGFSFNIDSLGLFELNQKHSLYNYNSSFRMLEGDVAGDAAIALEVNNSVTGLPTSFVILDVDGLDFGVFNPSSDSFYINTTNEFINLQSKRGSVVSNIKVISDSIVLNPDKGFFNINLLKNRTGQNALMGWDSTGSDRGQVGYVTVGSGLTLGSGSLSVSSIPTGLAIKKAYAPFVVSNDSISQRYNVLAYGADNTGVADATLPIQNAINACISGGGGMVYFPNGTYLISGALQTSVSGANPNSQLYIPFPNTFTDSTRTSITFLGESAPNITPGGLSVNSSPSQRGVRIISTLTSGSGTNPSVFGCNASSGFNYNFVLFKNLNILVQNVSSRGAVIGGINGGGVSSVIVEDCFISPNSSMNQISLEPTAEVAGIVTSQIGGETQSVIRNTIVVGFRYGFVTGEHTEIDQSHPYWCYAGIVPLASFHSQVITRSSPHWCKYSLYSVNAVGVAAGIVQMNILNLNVEVFAGTARWNEYTNVVYDPSNFFRGEMEYNVVRAGVGIDNSLFNMSGGVYLNPRCLNTDGTVSRLRLFSNVTTVSGFAAEQGVIVKNSNAAAYTNGIIMYNDVDDIGQVMMPSTSGAIAGTPLAARRLNFISTGTGGIGFWGTEASSGDIFFTTRGAASPQVTIGSGGTLTATNLAGTGDRMVQVSSAGLFSASVAAPLSGTYTPTLTNSTNLDASTAYSCQYMRVGNTVTVSGRVDLDVTLTASSTVLGISLPIASNIANANEAGGTGYCPTVAAMGAALLGDATNDRVTLQFISSDVNNNAIYFSFTYRII